METESTIDDIIKTVQRQVHSSTLIHYTWNNNCVVIDSEFFVSVGQVVDIAMGYSSISKAIFSYMDRQALENHPWSTMYLGLVELYANFSD